MSRGDKDKYTDKQKRMAEHIEDGYEKRGISEKEAEGRAWATVNRVDHGGKMPGGSGRGRAEDHESMRKGGRQGGTSQSIASRIEAAKRGWETRRKNAEKRKS